MQTETIPLDETDCFSSFFIDYIKEKSELADFYSAYPTVENFETCIKKRSLDKKSRAVLVKALQEQYTDLSTSGKTSENIKSLLEEKTFTVTTGHQLNIFTGPLYFIYKIVTVINACRVLKKKYPKYNFVPVYWMASEDHDFDEINHFHFDGKKYEWTTNQTGAVGRFALDDIQQLLKQLPKGIDFFNDAYNKSTLAEAARYYVNYLFAEEGIVVMDADDPELKKLLVPVIEDDLFNHSAFESSGKDTKELQELGYKTQVSAREINFFYLDDGVRERIEKKGTDYLVVNTDLKFSEDEIKALIKSKPERFSPNVILRPLYQELILPNLAYVGGPSEVVYWLQLKSLFQHFKTSFPILMPRNFATIIPSRLSEKWGKTGLLSKDLFLTKEEACKKWVGANSGNELSYQKEIKDLQYMYSNLGEKASKIDPTLKQHIEALQAIAEKKLVKAEKKLYRAEKRKHQDKEAQICEVKDALFPNGSLQERHDNFLNFYLQNPSFIQTLLDTFDPFDFSMYLIPE